MKYQGKYLAYNYNINKAIILNDKLHSLLQLEYNNEEEVRNAFKFLNQKEVDSLKRAGVFYENRQDYEDLYYSKRLLSRITKVDLSIVYFHVTQRCNLRCTYCYNRENLNKSDLLSTDDIKSTLTNLKMYGVKTIVFTGGEATIREDIVEIIKFTKDIGLGVQLLTNGSYLINKKEIMEYLDYVIISLDTLSEDNNQRLGLNISKLMDDLKALCVEYNDKIALRSVISKYNVSDWMRIKLYAEEELRINFMPTLFIPNNLNEVQDMINHNEVKFECDGTNFSGNICGATYKILAIDSNGDLFPCQCLIKDSFKLGNVLSSDWYEKLSQHKITQDFMKRTVLDIDKCNKCNYKYICGGGCRAIAFNLYESLDSYIECLCEYQKAIAIEKLNGLLVHYG